MMKFNVSATNNFRSLNGVCVVGTIRQDLAFIRNQDPAIPPLQPLIRSALGSQRLETDFSAQFCLATTYRPENETTPLVNLYSRRDRIGFFSVSDDEVHFQLSGQHLTVALDSADFGPDRFVQLQLCYSRVSSRLSLYIGCASSPKAAIPFSIPSSTDVEGLSIIQDVRGIDDTPVLVKAVTSACTRLSVCFGSQLQAHIITSNFVNICSIAILAGHVCLTVFTSFLPLPSPPQGAVQQLYLLQCPAIPSSADQRSLQCRDIPFDCSINTQNSQTEAANNIRLTVQRFFNETAVPTQPVSPWPSYSLLATHLAAAVAYSSCTVCFTWSTLSYL